MAGASPLTRTPLLLLPNLAHIQIGYAYCNMSKGSLVNTQTAIMFKSLRTQLGMSFERFAQEMGTSKSTIYRWENDVTQHPSLTIPQIKALFRLMEQAGLDPLKDFIEN